MNTCIERQPPTLPPVIATSASDDDDNREQLSIIMSQIIRYKVNDKLVALFYLLMRDHLPVGDVIKLVNDIKVIAINQNPHLEALAQDLVDKLK